MTISIIAPIVIAGKARQVFPFIALLAKVHGEKTLKELEG